MVCILYILIDIRLCWSVQMCISLCNVYWYVLVFIFCNDMY